MKSLVVFDSLYGNTQKIAQVIADSLSSKALSVTQVNISDLNNLNLLVIGSPIHGGQATPAIQQFLSQLNPKNFQKIKVAVFDTRFLEKDVNFALKLLLKTIGYAAPKMAATLTSNGFTLLTPPCGFIVKGKEGPLSSDQLDQAKNWLKNIVAK